MKEQCSGSGRSGESSRKEQGRRSRSGRKAMCSGWAVLRDSPELVAKGSASVACSGGAPATVLSLLAGL